MSDNDISKRSIKPKEDIDSKILELTKIIEEKDIGINKLQEKIMKFGKNIDELKQENDQLKKEIKNLEKEINDNKFIFPSKILNIQPTQRFIVFSESINNSNSQSFFNLINNDYSKDNNNNTINTNKSIWFDGSLNNKNNSNIKCNNNNYITNNLDFNSKITPFKMQPYKIFDHKKLDINFKDFENNFLDEELLNEIKKNNTSIINNMTMSNYSVEQVDNSNMNLNSSKKSNPNSEGIKIHSSMFFKNCKKVMNKNEYRNLIEIVKLSNSKKITKEETYLMITNLLENNYPELSNEFKLLFV